MPERQIFGFREAEFPSFWWDCLCAAARQIDPGELARGAEEPGKLARGSVISAEGEHSKHDNKSGIHRDEKRKARNAFPIPIAQTQLTRCLSIKRYQSRIYWPFIRTRCGGTDHLSAWQPDSGRRGTSRLWLLIGERWILRFLETQDEIAGSSTWWDPGPHIFESPDSLIRRAESRESWYW